MVKNVIVECDTECVYNKFNGYCRAGYCHEQEIKIKNGVCVSRKTVQELDNKKEEGV